MELAESDARRVEYVLRAFWPDAESTTITECMRALLKLSDHSSRTRYAATFVLPNMTNEQIADAVLTAAADWDSHRPFPKANTDPLDVELEQLVQQDEITVEVGLPLLGTVYQELESVINILGAVHKHVPTKPDQADIRKHRAQCKTLHAELRGLVPLLPSYRR